MTDNSFQSTEHANGHISSYTQEILDGHGRLDITQVLGTIF